MRNRRYDPDFKREAGRMVVEGGLSVRCPRASLGAEKAKTGRRGQ